MRTEKQAAANRANARHSTGPKTRAGKKRVSQNAMRHGLTAKTGDARWDPVIRQLAHTLLAEHEKIGEVAAFELAESLIRRRQVSLAEQLLIESALEHLDPALPEPEREDTARLNILCRLVALQNIAQRRAATLRKQLRRVAD